MKSLNSYLTENAIFTTYYVKKFIEEKIGRDVMIKYNFDMHIPMSFVDWVSIYIPMYMDEHKLKEINFKHWHWLTVRDGIRTSVVRKDSFGRGYVLKFEPEEQERTIHDYIEMLLAPRKRGLAEHYGIIREVRHNYPMARKENGRYFIGVPPIYRNVQKDCLRT